MKQSNVNMLVVDDSATMRKMEIRALRAAGLSSACFLEAGNGREALQILESSPVDAVFTDLHMPAMDGCELVGRMRDETRWVGIPVVVLTSHVRTHRVEALVDAGAILVSKPFTAEHFRPVLDRIMPLIRGNIPVSREAIYAVARRVLETLAFAVVAEGVEPEVDSYGDALRATVSFSGAWAGCVRATTDRATLKSLEANMLGESGGADEAPADILGEIADVLAGALADELFGIHARVELGLPTVEPAGQRMQSFPEEPVSAVRLLLDEGWIEVCVARDVAGELVGSAGGNPAGGGGE